MSTPAERYAAARRRAAAGDSPVEEFAAGFDFDLDEFQLAGCEAVAEGKGALVAAPTGAGKTIVGEFAVHLGLQTGRKTFYTTPIKALSNQKYHDLVRRHGAENVGLLTGDSSVNGEAPVVVMTTEVLRNMLYGGSGTLAGLGFVVMDEVHYLADRFRGAVWEEVIIHLPAGVQIVSLSATVSNAEEFGDWLGEVRGNTEVIVSEHRPVPLWQHMMVGRELYDLFVDEAAGPTSGVDADGAARVNPELLDRIRADERTAGQSTGWRREDAGGPRGRHGRNRRGRASGYGSGPKGRGGVAQRHAGGSGARGGRAGFGPAGPRGRRGPSPAEVIDRLDRDGLLPAITFIFSRVGCEAAVGQLLAWGSTLVDEEEGRRVRRHVEDRVVDLADEDLAVLGYGDFVEGLSRGFAAHHAGMLPLFREIVEELFTAGRIKAVFATETLALGINMPARTVVLEKLVKFNGETHADITPAEYTQLTGRAGRRGIDVEGHAVVLHHRGVDPLAVAGLASTRTYPLRSSFRPTYNMAVNLVDQVGRHTAAEILETSFAQFQADRAVVGLAGQVRRNEDALDGYAEAMQCDVGDFREYAALRNEIRDVEKDAARKRSAGRRAEAAMSLQQLRPGDVVRVPGGRRAGFAVVIQGNRGGKREGPLPTVLTADARIRRITETDVHEPLEPVAQLDIPKHFNARNAKSKRDLAATLRVKAPHDPPPRTRPATPNETLAEDNRVAELRRRMRDHPCHQCPDREDHARWAERWWKLRRETDRLQGRVSNRTNSVARTFDRICDLLGDLGYLSGDRESVTPAGQTLRGIYTEKDLLAAECLRQGVWRQLDTPGLAAVVSILIHEPRREQAEVAPRMPNHDVHEAYTEMVRIWGALEDRETAHRLPLTGEPEGGMAPMVYRWASGQSLEVVLADSEMAAGDFVRRCKQVVDLLGQIARIAGQPALARTARRAGSAVLRGVVAADRLD